MLFRSNPKTPKPQHVIKLLKIFNMRAVNELNNQFRYTTRRMIIIDSYFVGILYRILQLAILTYFIAFPLVYQKYYKRTQVYPINLSTRIVGSQVLRDDSDNVLYVEAMDVSSPDQYSANSFNFALREVRNWQRRTN